MLPASLETAVYGVIATPALHLAAKHGMLRRLVTSGPATGEALAGELRLDPDTVERLLLVLVAFGLLERTGDGLFGIAPGMRPFLTEGGPDYIGGFVEHLMTETLTRLPVLDDYLLYGKQAADAGRPAAYAQFYRDEAATRDFMNAMWALSFGVSHELAELLGLEGHRRLVDVGGANGPFAVAALQRSPELSATVFDLEQVRPYLEESRERHGLDGRLDFAGGDFFRDELPRGDLFTLGYVMSNWPDEACLRLLRKAYDACEPGGRVVIMDRLFDDGRDGPVATAVMNLVMQFETDGRHRTPAEFLDLLSAAGFPSAEIRRGTRDKHLVIGHR